jgi:hypothetical protein
MATGSQEPWKPDEALPHERPAPTVYSLPDLMAMHFDPPRWAVPGVIAQGFTLLCGRPKIGKSWLCLGLCLAIAYGGKALGRVQVEQGETLYLALEDTEETIQERAAMIGIENNNWPAGMHIAVNWARMGGGGLEDLIAWLTEHPDCRLVIIDTLGKIKPLQTRTRTLYDEDYQTGAALKAVADHFKIALVVIHHVRKASGDDVMDTVSATLGLTGAADATIIIGRGRGTADATLSLTGRRVREQSLAMTFDPATVTWAVVGDAGQVKDNQEDEEVIRVVAEADWPLTPKEVHGRLPNRKQATIGWRLWKLAKAGKLKNLDGKYAPAPAMPTPIGTVTQNPNRSNPPNRDEKVSVSSALSTIGANGHSRQSAANSQSVGAIGAIGTIGGIGAIGATPQPFAPLVGPPECVTCGRPLPDGWFFDCPECYEKGIGK